jgi:hypothetical protein
MENEAETTGSAPGPGQPRNIFLRIFFGFLWFIGLRIVTSAMIGAIVGEGAQVSMDFTVPYGRFVLIGQVLLFVALCYFRILPGISKYKR